MGLVGKPNGVSPMRCPHAWLGDDGHHGDPSKLGGIECVVQALLGLADGLGPVFFGQQVAFVEHHYQVVRGDLPNHQALRSLCLQACQRKMVEMECVCV